MSIMLNEQLAACGTIGIVTAEEDLNRHRHSSAIRPSCVRLLDRRQLSSCSEPNPAESAGNSVATNKRKPA